VGLINRLPQWGCPESESNHNY